LPHTLLILRHAKASWDRPGLPDFDRPLTERGRSSIADVGVAMARAGYLPRRVLCSSALRTRETLAGLLPHFATDLEVTLTRRLYEADAGDLLELIQGLGSAPTPLLLVGHNPGLEDLANLLVTDGDADARLAMAAKFPTCALAVIELPIETWAGAGTSEGALVDFLTPGRAGVGADGD
jgi:phosphohistidine phosphatase